MHKLDSFLMLLSRFYIVVSYFTEACMITALVPRQYISHGLLPTCSEQVSALVFRNTLFTLFGANTDL